MRLVVTSGEVDDHLTGSLSFAVRRAPFHRHEESYFWTILGNGRSRSHYHDAAIKEVDYMDGDTRHFELTSGEYFVHDLENIGATTLTFITVEFKREGS